MKCKCRKLARLHFKEYFKTNIPLQIDFENASVHCQGLFKAKYLIEKVLFQYCLLPKRVFIWPCWHWQAKVWKKKGSKTVFDGTKWMWLQLLQMFVAGRFNSVVAKIWLTVSKIVSNRRWLIVYDHTFFRPKKTCMVKMECIDHIFFWDWKKNSIEASASSEKIFHWSSKKRPRLFWCHFQFLAFQIDHVARLLDFFFQPHEVYGHTPPHLKN